MHYYKRNLGDYAKKAGRLSMLQHGAYTLLIDSCYDREQFPTLEEAIEWTWASSSAEIEAVEFVLRKFFTLKDGIYVQHRIQEEIGEYKEKSTTNKRIALERESKRKENITNRAPIVNESSPNQEPRTNNQEPRTNNQEPINTKSKTMSPQVAATSKKGTSLPENWVLPKAWGEWAATEKSNLTRDDILSIADQFKDHWLANSNQRTAKKSNWQAAWRNWVRRHKENSKPFLTPAQIKKQIGDAAESEFLKSNNFIEGEFHNV